MGNKVPNADSSEMDGIYNSSKNMSKSKTTTPVKKYKEDTEEKDQKSKSETKEKTIFSSNKPFQTFENTNIFGYNLNTDPEDREYFVSCPVCKAFILDKGFSNTITCKKCFTVVDPETKKIVSLSKKAQTDSFFETTKKNFTKPQNQTIKYLFNLVLQIDKDTISTLFGNNEKIDYELIAKRILLPYFKIKSRILQAGYIFYIGEIGFKVIGAHPFKKGIVSSKTNIQCNSFYSSKEKLSRVLLITTQKYNNFDQESLISELKNETSNNKYINHNENIAKNIMLNKNEVTNIKFYEFLVRNCVPETGIITKDTILTIENKDILNVAKIKLAVLRNNTPDFRNSEERKTFEDYVSKEYYKPFFLSGVKRYLEKGDFFQIENLEFFVLSINPEKGFITQDTNVLFKFGMNKSDCLEKLKNDDNNFVQSLIQNEDDNNTNAFIRNLSQEEGLQSSNNITTSSSSSSSSTGHRHIDHTRSNSTNENDVFLNNNLVIHSNQFTPRIRGSRIRANNRDVQRLVFTNLFNNMLINRIETEIQNENNPSENETGLGLFLDVLRNAGNRTRLRTSQNIIDNLPSFKVDENYKTMLTRKKDINKGEHTCVICMSDFEVEQIIKTVPCFHIFHDECITRWLQENTSCPICKTEVK